MPEWKMFRKLWLVRQKISLGKPYASKSPQTPRHAQKIFWKQATAGQSTRNHRKKPPNDEKTAKMHISIGES